MRHPCRPLPASLFALFLTLPASALDRAPAGDPRTPNAAIELSSLPEVLTGKERLGKKWMDEQRIDDCKVPIDKRGTKLPPSACPQDPTG